MNFIPTSIPDILLIEPQVFGDHCGFFMETFRASALAEANIGLDFVQDNQVSSQQRTLCGLHYSIRQARGKLVRAVVVVDIRCDSPTFGQWVDETLSV